MTIELSEVGEVLDRIYKTECPIRLEYVWDGGWVWTVLGVDNKEAWPRVWIDDDIEGNFKISVMNEAVRDRIETIHKQEKDWLYRGQAKPINEAVHAMACALYLEIPDSEFGRWWKTKIDAR